jgi:type II secretory pathway pseudopilin PulG
MKIDRKKRATKNREGAFTLVETLVAITVFLLVIIGPMTIASKGLQNAFFANEQTTATFLAQEALESVIRLRDENALDVLDGGAGSDDTWEWLGDLPAGCQNTNVRCGYDPTVSGPNMYFPCTGDDCLVRVRPNPVGNKPRFFGHGGGGWSDSIYTRKLYLEEVSSGKVKIEVTVSWGTTLFSGNSRTVTLQSWIMDHYDRFEP